MLKIPLSVLFLFIKAYHLKQTQYSLEYRILKIINLKNILIKNITTLFHLKNQLKKV